MDIKLENAVVDGQWYDNVFLFLRVFDKTELYVFDFNSWISNLIWIYTEPSLYFGLLAVVICSSSHFCCFFFFSFFSIVYINQTNNFPSWNFLSGFMFYGTNFPDWFEKNIMRNNMSTNENTTRPVKSKIETKP